ncbi:Reversal of tor2 lethality [Microsporum audouinii]
MAELDPRLTGTWTTKSRKVVTGPGFYDPIKDRLIEPSHTGISYSFTDDGYFEEAHYRAISNPQNPACPSGMMLFQHGTYDVKPNGTLVLNPYTFEDDGRQLISDPCKGKKASYYRYNQNETFKRYEVQLDEFHNIPRLNLYTHDGSPMNRMFLIYKPPQMLPTKHLNPVVKTPSRRKRDLADGEFDTPLNKNTILTRQLSMPTHADRWWWVGVLMTSIGGIALIYS